MIIRKLCADYTADSKFILRIIEKSKMLIIVKILWNHQAEQTADQSWSYRIIAEWTADQSWSYEIIEQSKLLINVEI